MLPGVLVVLGMVVFYGNNGALNHWLALLFPDRGWRFTGLYGFWGIILAHVFYNFTFCLRLTGEAWERINPALHEASALLGAGPFYTWRRVTLPLLAPTLLYLFLLVFLYSFLSFTVVLVLGGYLYKTFEVLIYIEYSSRLRFARAALIAIVNYSAGRPPLPAGFDGPPAPAAGSLPGPSHLKVPAVPADNPLPTLPGLRWVLFLQPSGGYSVRSFSPGAPGPSHLGELPPALDGWFPVCDRPEFSP